MTELTKPSVTAATMTRKLCTLVTAIVLAKGATLSFAIAQPLETRPSQQTPPNAERGQMEIAGAGFAKCSKLNSQGAPGRPPQMLGTRETAMIISWVQGYISGLNMGSMAQVNTPQKGYFDLASISVEEQWAFVTVYCQHNPDSPIYDAAIELMRKRLKWVQ